MRIGYVSTHPPIECGIATYTQALNEAVRKRGYESFVIGPFGSAGEQVFPVYHQDSPTMSFDIFNTASRLTPDVVHIQHEYGIFGPQRGAGVVDLIVRLRLAHIPVVTTLHTVYSELTEQEQVLLRYICEGSAAVIVHEEFQRDTLQRYLGVGDKVHVIEHGVREITPLTEAKSRLSTIGKLRLQGKKVVMLCGYFRPSKRFHQIIQQFGEICAGREDIVLIVAGKLQSAADEPYARQLHELASQSPAAKQIHFLRGQFPQYTFDMILSAADCVVLPYEMGAQSGMLAQCFALGRPTVVSALPAFEQLVQRSGGGLVCHSDDQYPTAIRSVLDDKRLRQKLQDNMRNYVSQCAGWSLIGKQHLDVYTQVTSGRDQVGQYVYFPEPKLLKTNIAPTATTHQMVSPAEMVPRSPMPHVF